MIFTSLLKGTSEKLKSISISKTNFGGVFK